MDRNERNRLLAQFDELFVETPRIRSAAEAVESLFESGVGHEGQCLLLLGPTGSSKTLTIKRCRMRHPPNFDGARNIHPILVVEVPAGCTLKTLAGAILDALGAVFPTKGTQVELTRRVLHHLKKQGVRLIVLDEAQHLIDKATDRIAYDAADWLKTLLNAAACSVVLVGQVTTERVVLTNPQLQRRCAGVIYMQPYDWGQAEDRAEYRVFLAQIDQAYRLPEPSGLSCINTALRFYAFSRGLRGDTVRLARKAYESALDRSLPSVSHNLIAEAVDFLRVGPQRRLANPFRMAEVDPVPPAPMCDDTETRRHDAEALRMAKQCRKPTTNGVSHA